MSSQTRGQIGLAIVLLAGIIFIFTAYQAYLGFTNAHEYKIDNPFYYKYSYDKKTIKRYNDKGIRFSVISVISGIVLIYGFRKIKKEE